MTEYSFKLYILKEDEETLVLDEIAEDFVVYQLKSRYLVILQDFAENKIDIFVCKDNVSSLSRENFIEKIAQDNKNNKLIKSFKGVNEGEFSIGIPMEGKIQQVTFGVLVYPTEEEETILEMPIRAKKPASSKKLSKSASSKKLTKGPSEAQMFNKFEFLQVKKEGAPTHIPPPKPESPGKNVPFLPPVSPPKVAPPHRPKSSLHKPKSSSIKSSSGAKSSSVKSSGVKSSPKSSPSSGSARSSPPKSPTKTLHVKATSPTRSISGNRTIVVEGKGPKPKPKISKKKN